ncbi:MAG: hypothetical protein IJ094_09130 [Bacilli bacterium]|nr:hypothetical protein [Bacilli bacterium]
MTQSDCVAEIMENNCGYAELSDIYAKVVSEYLHIFNIKNYKTNIRGLLQKERHRYFKVRPGIWALIDYKGKLPKEIEDLIEDPSISYFDKPTEHAKIQSDLIYIGKELDFTTYIYGQDKKRVYNDKGNRLEEIVDIVKIPNFTYKKIVDKIRSIDVIWFSNNVEEGFKYPEVVFEVESSTNIKNSLNKFNYLKSFNIKVMYIVAPKKREKQFNKIIELDEYKEIKSRVKFLYYEDIEYF